MNFNTRLLELMKHLGENPTSFGKKLDSSTGENIRLLTKNDHANPSLDILSEIVTKYPDINARWLLTGEGKMYGKRYDQVIPVKDVSAEQVACVTTYSCPDCISKQREIDALNKALDAKEELLDKYRADVKKETGSSRVSPTG